MASIDCTLHVITMLPNVDSGVITITHDEEMLAEIGVVDSRLYVCCDTNGSLAVELRTPNDGPASLKIGDCPATQNCRHISAAHFPRRCNTLNRASPKIV